MMAAQMAQCLDDLQVATRVAMLDKKVGLKTALMRAVRMVESSVAEMEAMRV